MSTLCGRLKAGFEIDCDNPTVGGIDDLIVLFNKDEVTLTYDTVNPGLVTDITPLSGKKLYAFYGVNNSFGSMCKQTQGLSGPRFTHEIDFNVIGNSSDIKEQLLGLGYGRVGGIVFNNYKAGDSGIELLGAVHGLVLSEAERNTGDEAMDGGYKLKLATPAKLKESNWPAAIGIPPMSGPATYDSTKTAIFALLT